MGKNARLEEEMNLLKTSLNYNKVELESINQPRTKVAPLLIAVDLQCLQTTAATELLNKFLEVEPLLRHTPRVRFITNTGKKRPSSSVLHPLVLCFLNEHYVAFGKKIIESDGHIDLSVLKKHKKQKQRHDYESGNDNQQIQHHDEPHNERDHWSVETPPDSVVELNENKEEYCAIEIPVDSGIESDGHVDLSVPRKQKKRRQQRHRNKNDNNENDQQKDRHEPDNNHEKEYRIVEMPPPDSVVELNKNGSENHETRICKKEEEDNWINSIAQWIYTSFVALYKRFFSRRR